MRAIVFTDYRYLAVAPLVAALAPANLWAANDLLSEGKRVYEYYCYQCHGYGGDARTLATTYLDPRPRDFTAADPERLDTETMRRAVRRGRPGTAMKGFTRILDEQAVRAVVAYIRHQFMSGEQSDFRYHTGDNGWPDHERYEAAAPFATGETPLDTAWEDLDPRQRSGKRLYLSACISCHDRARTRDPGPAWEPRAVSYPRRHYSHRSAAVDTISAASPYHLHDRPVSVAGAGPALRRGEALYLENCAFCHAADGTGRNWIGSFLQPLPRDLTGARVKAMDREALARAIRRGLPGTTMPAWDDVLTDRQIDDLVSYVMRAFGEVGTRGGREGSARLGAAPKNALSWRRQPVE
ncbi:MAG: cytochrome c [Gammaproteobacteria bacterium]|nr:cytochrome c [Gammaproteobacteria bacterium]NIR97307.1 cytochrome c [Gammaproteobacteria bacterium]NIT63350.1 cytochrome c [Gammaproteobacteria bacterium]NIV20277.1 c-type cytochrome [Gammaproteobacteria bacterium]NIX10694.1 c-type cytochrome [Gammaproteobacteria bacterium]